MLLCSAAFAPIQAQNTTVTTVPQWNGIDAQGEFGEGGISDATYGQTFTVPSGVDTLSSFAFFLDDLGGADSVHFQAFVMAWNGSMASGPVLFQSGPLSSSDIGVGTFQRFNVVISGGLRVVPGATYVAFFSASNLFDGNPGSANVGAVNAGTYAGGEFVSLNNGSNFGAVTTNPWSTLFGVDLAFDFVFTNSENGEAAAPVPVILIDAAAISSAMFSSVPTALAQRELALGAARVTLRDFNGRLFRRRAGAAVNPVDVERTYYTLTVGEGDGIEPLDNGKGVTIQYGLGSGSGLLWQIFTSFDYGNLDLDADRYFLGLQSDTYAGSIGAELLIGPETYVGGGVSYLESYSDGGTDVDGLTFATYISNTWHGLHTDLLYDATLLDHDIRRNAGFGSTAQADPGSLTQTLSFNTGDFYSLGHWTLGPFLGLEYARADIDGYTERGGGTGATRVSEQSAESLISRVGFQASYRVERSWGSVTPQVRVGWERENLASDDDLTVGLLQSPYYLVQGNTIRSTGEGFKITVSSDDRRRDYMTLGAGVLVEFSSQCRVLLDYEGNFQGEDYRAHFAKLSLGFTF